jgi:hypothetical protein
MSNSKLVYPDINILPLLRLTSHNITSARAYANSSEKLSRLREIGSLCLERHVIFVQESKLAFLDHHSLDHASHDHTPFYNNDPRNHNVKASCFKAGTAIFISRSLSSSYTITALPLPLSLQGSAQILSLSHKQLPTTILLINLYLPSTADSARIAFLKLLLPHLKLLPTHTAVYLGGDFNFTTNPMEDNSGPVGHPTSPKLIKYWDRVTETLGLRELPQTSHTYYHLSSNKYSSSRLDRFYIALNESAITSFTPRCRYPPTP